MPPENYSLVYVAVIVMKQEQAKCGHPTGSAPPRRRPQRIPRARQVNNQNCRKVGAGLQGCQKSPDLLVVRLGLCKIMGQQCTSTRHRLRLDAWVYLVRRIGDILHCRPYQKGEGTKAFDILEDVAKHTRELRKQILQGREE